MRRSSKSIDWYQVERAIRSSVTGRGLNEDDMDLVTRAQRTEPRRYAALHKQVKQEEIDKKRRFG